LPFTNREKDRQKKEAINGYKQKAGSAKHLYCTRHAARLCGNRRWGLGLHYKAMFTRKRFWRENAKVVLRHHFLFCF